MVNKRKQFSLNKLKKYSFLLFLTSLTLLSQSKDTYFFKGNINLNNNGIDWIPLFSRDKPTLISNFSFGKERFSVNPLIRYDLEGFQMWGIDIYWNYRFIEKNKFTFDFGAFLPGVFTQKVNVTEVKLPKSILQPWSAAMFNPNITFLLNKKISLKVSYYQGFPLKRVNTDMYDKVRMFFLSPILSGFNLNDNLILNWIPQIYSIELDNEPTGFFAAQTISLTHKSFPFSVSSVMNKPIYFGGLSGKKFDWNIALNYSFELFFEKKSISN